MYHISNRSRDEAIYLLGELRQIAAKDTRTVNIIRRAKLLQRKLANSQKIDLKGATTAPAGKQKKQ